MNIEIQQPQPFDLVGETILISGNAVGFESYLSIYVSDGHFTTGGSVSGAGSTSIRQFQSSITIPDDIDFQLDQLTISVSDEGGGAGDSGTQVDIPVLYGPRILEGYGGYWEHEVIVGDTLSNLAREYYDDASKWGLIHRVNIHTLPNPDAVSIGQVLRIPQVL